MSEFLNDQPHFQDDHAGAKGTATDRFREQQPDAKEPAADGRREQQPVAVGVGRTQRSTPHPHHTSARCSEGRHASSGRRRGSG
jgi:hypothetical protein